ncbi:hypothetical protein GUJ93_ZPchr0012g19821 [Zizania palustris]|uniref:Uncharacterized protein n=1 Tax=Zizania palustris TaxID=103762 RepID=A0A8J5WJJ3_ZIZPA|nr:hypothetical protein GUJ93_ZPchr0012g19821 [Zizania palustris]
MPKRRNRRGPTKKVFPQTKKKPAPSINKAWRPPPPHRLPPAVPRDQSASRLSPPGPPPRLEEWGAQLLMASTPTLSWRGSSTGHLRS